VGFEPPTAGDIEAVLNISRATPLFSFRGFCVLRSEAILTPISCRSREYEFDTSQNKSRIFRAKLYSAEKNFLEQRKTAARKFSNPRLLKICFTTFRHWKATMEYHKTRDILWVMRLLGHNSLKTTLIYIDLETALFKDTNDEFTVKVADTIEEACKLLEVGFEYVCEIDGKRIFRKRK
jgi:hypothetical protein